MKNLIFTIICSCSLFQVSFISASLAQTQDEAAASTGESGSPNEVIEDADPADARPVTSEEPGGAIKPIAATRGSASNKRAEKDFLASVHYSYFDLILPGKYGLSVGMFSDEFQSWEIEYTRGSFGLPWILDHIASMTEERISLVGKSYIRGRSFYLSYGLAYHRLNFRLGTEYLRSVANIPGADVIDYQMLGVHAGLGHQWFLGSGWILSADWFAWSQPLLTLSEKNKFVQHTSNSEYRDEMKTAIDVIKYLPRLTALRVNVGYTF